MGCTIRIMSHKDFKKYTLAVARGEIKPPKSKSQIYFESIESMAQVLSTKNRELLKIIKEENPESLSELSNSSGRKISNLSRTLKMMEKYGIVVLEKNKKSIKPSLCEDNFRAVFRI